MTNSVFGEIKELQLQAEKIRKCLLQIVYSAKAGHIGGSLSSVDVETALYFYVMNINPSNPLDPNRDRFILSKGHSVEAYYAVLAAKGFIDQDLLDTYGHFGSRLVGHPTKKIPGIELNSGALGHGLSVGVGLSIAAQLDRKAYKTFVMMGDGEQGEGSIYEAAMAANQYKLGNLVAIIDRNSLQISGLTEDVMSLEPMRERWEAFGWQVFDVQGNDMEDLVKTFDAFDYGNGKPKLIISHTTKGKGISYMENVAKWHHSVPNEAQFKQAIQEIEARINTLEL
jgi:transketolase